jgi:mannose-6-phosphate isomerase-like protein (cupin superfamily)
MTRLRTDFDDPSHPNLRANAEFAPTPGERFGIPLPGGTSVSHVRVYDTVGPDGLAGGSPHLHTVCTEAYLVIAGEGLVQTLSGEGDAETPLVAGTIAWFSPGTVHRLVNLDGRLELYVLMSNAGLPEAGDMILAFEPELLTDEDTYRSMADLPADGRTTDHDPAAAMRRRDAAVRGFHHWRTVVADRGPSALEPLHRRAVELLGDRPEGWLELLAGDPAVDLERSRAQVEELWTPDRSGAAARLGESTVRSRSLHPDVRRMGCCGTLGTVVH